MTQVCSLPSSTADVNDTYNNKRLPKGIHIVGADRESVSKVGGIPKSEGHSESQNPENQALRAASDAAVQPATTDADRPRQGTPWGYIFIQHMYNPQIQISAESGTKRSIFRQKNKTKRSKNRLHTTLIKPEQKVNKDLCSGFVLS